MRAVAEAVVLRGASLREAAVELGVTLWAVRQQRDKLLARFVYRAEAQRQVREMMREAEGVR
jgi:hypothetical protein